MYSKVHLKAQLGSNTSNSPQAYSPSASVPRLHPTHSFTIAPQLDSSIYL